MESRSFAVTGMSCGHCEAAIRQEVQAVPGVSQVQVSSQTGVLQVQACAEVAEAAILAAVQEAGYTAVPTS